MQGRAHLGAGYIVGGVTNDVKVKPEIILSRRHIIAHELDIWRRR